MQALPSAADRSARSESYAIIDYLGRGIPELAALLIQLISGAIGGNIAGGLLKNYSLGGLGNTIAGVVGGGIGGQLLGALMPAAAGAATGGMDIGSIIGQIVGGGVGIVMVIVGLIRQAMAGGGSR